MKRLVSSLLGLDRPSARRRRHARFEPECLERREVPAAAGIIQDGVAIVVNTTNAGDTVEITMNDNGTPTGLDDVYTVKWTRGDTGAVVTKSFTKYKYVNQGDEIVPVLNVSYVYVYGGDGNDVIKNNTSLQSGLFGMGGNDKIHGGSGTDVIKGGAGNDVLYGGEGADQLFAYGFLNPDSDPGALDVLYGEGGTDTLFGGRYQTNYLYGGTGYDVLYGGHRSAVNHLYGGSGNDLLKGGDNGATNFLYGGSGNDQLIGGSSDFGLPKTMNTMVDDEGKDTFWGGDRAMNFMYAGDGGSLGQEDLIILGQINSYDYWQADGNDVVWNPKTQGQYPKPKP
jgi:Ca2+-binding RTX toxin-like protein